MRRAFWATLGLGAGAVIGLSLARWASKTKERYAPPNLARGATSKLDELRIRLFEAIEAGAEEMAQREAELREELGLPAQ